MKSGLYKTEYGNTAEYMEGDKTAYDIDMGEEIPLEMLSERIMDIDDKE